MNEALLIRRPEIFAICKRFKVKRLDVFGDSVSGGKDIGFLVDFLEYGPWHNVEAYYGLQRALECIFDEEQDIDYLDVAALKDPYVKRMIEKTRTPFYVHET